MEISMPSSSRISRTRHCWDVSPSSRLPPGNSQSPPRCASARRCVMSSLPLRKINAAETSICFLSSDTFVNPTEPDHLLVVEKIPSVEKNRVRERFFGAVEVELLEFIPFGRDNERVAAFGHGVHVVNVGHVWQNRLRLAHRLRVVNTERRAFLQQPLAQINRWR